VAGDHAAAISGNPGDRVPHLALERVELGEIGGGVRVVSGLAGRIGGNQRVADIGHIDFRIGDGLPGMRVGPAMVMVVTAGPLARLYTFGRDHDRRLGAGRLDQALEPAFEAEPVHEHDIGLGHLLGVGRRRRVDMGIAIGTDQGADLDPVAANVLHEVAEDRERGDGLQPRLRLLRSRRADCQRDYEERGERCR
jgi:hypothetical protein